MKEDAIYRFITELQEKIELERKNITAYLGSPIYVRENYERSLRLTGMEDVLTMAMTHAAQKK